jgi:hypothetical protein
MRLRTRIRLVESQGLLVTATFLLLSAEARAALLYSNGGFSTGPKSKSGVSAPAGATFSEVQNDAASTTESNGITGFGAAQGGNRLADDFTVPAGIV